MRWSHTRFDPSLLLVKTQKGHSLIHSTSERLNPNVVITCWQRYNAVQELCVLSSHFSGMELKHSPDTIHKQPNSMKYQNETNLMSSAMKN